LLVIRTQSFPFSSYTLLSSSVQIPRFRSVSKTDKFLSYRILFSVSKTSSTICLYPQ
jgi:hypothetical protein